MKDFRCSYIVAASYPDLIIGDRQTNQLLWRIPEDMKRFREITIGSIVIMGKKTFDSLPGRKPLAGRVNIVLTRNVDSVVNDGEVDGVHFCNMITVFDIVKQYNDKRVFVIGGEEIYQLFWNYCECIYITFVKMDFTPLRIFNAQGNRCPPEGSWHPASLREAKQSFALGNVTLQLIKADEVGDLKVQRCIMDDSKSYAKFPNLVKMPDKDIFEDTEICRSYKDIKYVFMTITGLL